LAILLGYRFSKIAYSKHIAEEGSNIDNSVSETHSLIESMFDDLNLIGYNLADKDLFDKNGEEFKMRDISKGRNSIILRFFSYNCQDCYESIITEFNSFHNKELKINLTVLTDFSSPSQLQIFEENFKLSVPCFATTTPQYIYSDNTYNPYVIVLNNSDEIICSFRLQVGNDATNRFLLNTIISKI
jgi:hypothetical protein